MFFTQSAGAPLLNLSVCADVCDIVELVIYPNYKMGGTGKREL